MNYRTNHTMTAVASIAGLAIGAALGVLFAPKRGSELRSKLKFGRGNHYDQGELLKDHPVEDLWIKTRDHADRLQGSEKKRKDASRIKVGSAGTMAWAENHEE